MAAIVTASVSPNNCGHRTYTVSWDGQSYTVERRFEALTAEEKRQLVELMARYLEERGVSPSAFLNRCVIGEEATNVKQYDFLSPGSAITKTNIGTAYVNVLPGLNGERIPVDMTSAVEFRVFLNVNMVGTGPLRARIVRDADNAVLYENTNINVAAGERELDTGWQSVPAGFTGVELLRWQMASATATDDPVFRRMGMLVR